MKWSVCLFVNRDITSVSILRAQLQKSNHYENKYNRKENNKATFYTTTFERCISNRQGHSGTTKVVLLFLNRKFLTHKLA